MAVRILLDTHTFVWALVAPSRLSPETRTLLLDRENDVLVSPATAYEIVLKHALDKWPEVAPLAADVGGMVQASGFAELALTVDHMALAGRLPLDHRDPFDRMLAAQALTEGIPVITRDVAFRRFGVAVVPP